MQRDLDFCIPEIGGVFFFCDILRKSEEEGVAGYFLLPNTGVPRLKARKRGGKEGIRRGSVGRCAFLPFHFDKMRERTVRWDARGVL